MSKPLLAHAPESEPFTYHEALDRLNEEINELSLEITGGTYQFRSAVIPQDACAALTSRLCDRILHVGASRFSLRLLRDKKDLHPASFLNCRTGDGLIDHVSVKDGVVSSVLNGGGTLVFDHSQEHFPELQIIQENLEALLGCRCWIQCYLTKSQDTAFGMHGDDHPFVIVQLAGTKRWLHGDASDPDTTADRAEMLYQPGDIAFYPRGERHNVHGTGELSVHLTVAFDGFGGVLFDELPHAAKLAALTPRLGTSLPYSVIAQSVRPESTVRLAYSCLPPLSDRGDGIVVLETEHSEIRIPEDFKDALNWIKTRRKTSSADIAARFDIDIERCVKFVDFGLQNHLFLTGLGE
ncbi:MAG: cupin domain-containing protein [Pseudomonadota bacterium]